jgi:mitochondrial distribution and morphology protein 10
LSRDLHCIDTLLHATLHLPPPSTLHALFLRRLSPTVLLSFSLASSAPTGATVLAHLHHDVGKYSTEYLFSTDSALLGFRGLWNFGPDPRKESPSDPYNPPSLLSAGAEVYYSPLSSLAGISTGLRFTTLPGSSPHPNNPSHSHSTFPYTLALTLTPLTGSLETTYSVRASPNLAMSSRFGFNVYSWESEIVLGWEIWRRRRRAQLPTEEPDHFIETDWIYDRLAHQRNAAGQVPKNTFDVDKAESSDFDPDPWRTAAALQTRTAEREKDDSLLKIRIDQSWNVRLLWEGRMKELLLSAGVSLGPGMRTGSGYGIRDGGGMGLGWRGVGVEVSYSS